MAHLSIFRMLIALQLIEDITDFRIRHQVGVFMMIKRVTFGIIQMWPLEAEFSHLLARSIR